MDPTAQNTSTSAVNQPRSNAQGNQGGQQVQPQPIVQPQSSVSVPVGGKEQEALSTIGVQPSQPEVVVPQEVQEVGVEATPSEEPQLTQEHKELGVEAAKEATPLPHGPSLVQLPEDYKVPRGFFGLFHQQVKKAATWLFLLLFKTEQQKELKK